MHLRKEYNLPDSYFSSWDLDDWRLGARIAGKLEELTLEDKRS